MMIKWFTVNALPLASTDTQNLTHASYLSILRQIYCTARNGHSKVSFQGNTVNIIKVYIEVKIHILHILLYHRIGKSTNALLPPLLLRSPSPTDPVSLEQCVRGKRKAGTAHAHFLQLQHPYHTGTDHGAQSEKQSRTMFWVARCNVLYKSLWMLMFPSLPDGTNFW